MSRIMIVDDDPNVLCSLRRALLSMPSHLFGGRITIETFDDPFAALERAAESSFDVVIADYRMPDLDGVGFLTRMHHHYPQVERILLSGHGDTQLLLAAVNDVRVFRFLSKPWNNFELGTAIAQALEHSRSRAEERRLADLMRVQNEHERAVQLDSLCWDSIEDTVADAEEMPLRDQADSGTEPGARACA
jgi:two-component system, probable response regulator PhcQ